LNPAPKGDWNLSVGPFGGLPHSGHMGSRRGRGSCSNTEIGRNAPFAPSEAQMPKSSSANQRERDRLQVALGRSSKGKAGKWIPLDQCQLPWGAVNGSRQEEILHTALHSQR
jgi:hypothetical protein